MGDDDVSGSSPGAAASGNSPEGSQHGKLTEKAQRMVQIGLPWPDEEEMQHETRKMVVDAGVHWHIDKARLLPVLAASVRSKCSQPSCAQVLEGQRCVLAKLAQPWDAVDMHRHRVHA